MVRITPADTGRRVTVRARTHGTPPATDTVGVLRSWHDGVLTIERRDTTAVRIGEDDLLAARVVPDTGAGPHHRTRR